MSVRRKLCLAVLGIAVAAAAVLAFHFQKSKASASLPTAPARKGEFLVIVRCRGELRARRSVQVVAPVNVPQLRIVWLAPASGAVKAGEVVVRFDPSSAKQQVQGTAAALQQAQAALDQGLADTRTSAVQAGRDLAVARYAVETARLEVSKSEIVSRLKGEESKINLRVAEEDLNVKQAAFALEQASGKSKLASLTAQRDKAQAEHDLANHRLAQMEMKSPLTGIIVYQPNYSQGWLNAKPFKVGDQAWPGGVLAEIPDLTTLEMEGKLEENDRGRVSAGCDARVRLDSIPERPLAAKITAISPLTEQNWEWPPTRNFKAYAGISDSDPRLRPGMNGSVDVIVSRLPDAISVPAKALFTRRGKPVVYVAVEKQYRPKEVEVLARNPDEVAIRGIAPGTPVALAEPPQKAEQP